MSEIEVAAERIHEGGRPRYVEIKRFVQHAIERGEIKPGDRILSEAELVQRFGVSRMTANRALRELQDAGIVKRLPGVGSFVAEPTPIGQMIEIRNIANEIRARGHEYGARVIQNLAKRADAHSASLLGISVGTRIFHSIIVHYEAGVPLQLEERYVLSTIAPDYTSVDFTQTTPNEYLTRVAPLERVEHRVRAVMPDRRTAELLEMAVSEPVLVMTRQTWSRSRLVSHAWLTHPGDRFELSASFTV